MLQGGAQSISAITGALSGGTNFTTHAASGGSDVFTGDIDEVRVWDDRRTAAEFLNNKDAEISATSTNLIGYWKMDGPVSGTVTTVQDAHANNNDLADTGGGSLTYIDPGEAGNIIEKVNSFDVYVFDIFGQQLAEQFQWNWKAV